MAGRKAGGWLPAGGVGGGGPYEGPGSVDEGKSQHRRHATDATTPHGICDSVWGWAEEGLSDLLKKKPVRMRTEGEETQHCTIL